MRSPFKRRKESIPPQPFTGNCLVRCFTADGRSVGRCYHSTYGEVCPVHGNVGEYLADTYFNEITEGWPRDFELPIYNGSPWAERLRKEWEGR